MAAHHPLLERTNVALALNASFETNGSSGRFGVVSGYCITRRPREGGGRWRLIPAPLRKTTAAPAFAGATAVIGRNPPFSPVAANPLLHHRCDLLRSEEHTSTLQSLTRISYAVFCLKKKPQTQQPQQH